MAGISTGLRTLQKQVIRDLNIKRDMPSKVHKDFARNYAAEIQRGTVKITDSKQLQYANEALARFKDKIQRLGKLIKKL